MTPQSRRAAAEVGVASLAAGLVAGVLWRWIAVPRLPLARVDGDTVVVDETEIVKAFNADGWFAVLGLVAGLVLGALAQRRHRDGGAVVPLTLAVAGGAGSLLAWWLGMLIGPGPLATRAEEVPAGARLPLPLDLSAPGVLLLWPIAALVALLLTAAWQRPPGRRRSPSLSAIPGRQRGPDPQPPAR